MESKLSRWCDGFLEAGWLMAVIATPLFFNIHSERVFEPDKLTLLRSVALLMALIWIVKFVAQQGWKDLSWLGWKSDQSIWRKPLVAPVFAIVVVYIISTIFSVAPRTSLLGSYQRLQGTYSTLSYIVVFAVIASTMRTRLQVQRLITVIIITSIPVSLYGILQRLELDPLPWGGDTSSRIAGHMGNAIFIGAYLVMAVPLTAVRIIDSFFHILTDEDLEYADVVRSSIYILALAVQLMATYFTQSRGPLLGLAIGMFAFVLILLVTLRNATGERFGAKPLDYAMSFIYFGLGVVMLLVTNAMVPSLGGPRTFYLFGGLIGLLVLSIFVLAGARVGWRWLWSAWLAVILFVSLVIGAFNIYNTYPDVAESIPGVTSLDNTYESWRRISTIRRFGQMLNTEAGTSTVRLLIWEGVLDLIQPHEPIAFPDGEEDRWNALRPLIGYGPESMYVAYNRFYPPELAIVEARNASPDRSHNETFDALVITGATGFLAWQVLYLATFLQAFRSVGVVKTRGNRNILIALWVLGAAAGAGLALSFGGPVYLGIAIPFGSILGLVGYLVFFALASQREEQEAVQYDFMQLVMIGVIAAMIAYYVEIHFGIAIAATRLHSFVFMGLIFVLSYAMQPEGVGDSAETTTPARTTRKSRRARTSAQASGTIGPVIATTLILSLIMTTLVFDFVNFAPSQDEVQGWRSAADLPSSLEIFRRSMMVNPRDNFAASPYLYGVFVLSWFLATLLLVSEMARERVLKAPAATALAAGNKKTIVAALFAASTVLGIALYFTLSGDGQTNPQRVGALLAGLWAMLSAMAVGGLFVVPDVGRRFAGGVASVGLLFVLPLILIGTVWQALAIAAISIAALYFLWGNGWSDIFGPVLIVGIGSNVISTIYAMMHSALVRASFIAPNGSGGQPLQGLTRNIVEAERIGGYLSTYYGYVIVLLLLAGLAIAWKRMSAVKETGSTLAMVLLVALLAGGVYLVDMTNLNIIQADMTYKRGKPYDQQAGQLSRSVQNQQTPEQRQQALQASISNWKSAVAIYERAVEMAPNEDFYYLWLGRAYLEESSVNQAEQDNLLETARERLLRAQDINPLNTDHTANLARLNVRWAQLSSQDQRETRVDDAKRFYTDALELSPQNSIIRNEFAGLSLSLDNSCEDAIATYKESAEIDPYYDQTYLRLSETYVNCSQTNPEQTEAYLASAEQTIDDLLANMPMDIPARRIERTEVSAANGSLQIAQAYLVSGMPDEAIQVLDGIDSADRPNVQGQLDALRAQAEQLSGNSVTVGRGE